MVTKGLLLCAGMGTRLRPITHTIAKHLLPAANRPIIFYTIDKLVAAGITEIGIVVGSNRADFLRDVGDGSRWGIRIEYIEQKNPLGTAHAVQVARDWAGADPFVMVLGDILIQQGLDQLFHTFESSRPNGILVVNRTESPELYGIVELQDDAIVGLEEKPAHPKSNLAVAGIYIFDETIFSAIDRVEPSPRGELELPDAIRMVIEDGGRIEPFMLSGWWKDTGRPEDILHLNRLLLMDMPEASVEGSVDRESTLDGNVSIAETTTVENSVIRGPVAIGKNCTIRNARIGPYTSIGADVTLENAQIEYSIVMDGASIRSVSKPIDGSLIGRRASVCGSDDAGSLRFIVSDDSSVSGIS